MYNDKINTKNLIVPEEYIFRLFHLIQSYFCFNKHELKNITDYLKWGRQNFKYINFVDEYLMDDETIMKILLSDKTSEEMSIILKEKYGIESYLTKILDKKHLGGFTGNILNKINGSEIDKAKMYMKIKRDNLKIISCSNKNDNGIFTISANLDLMKTNIEFN